MNRQAIKKLKEKKISDIIKSGKGDALDIFYRWDATRIALVNITSAKLTTAVRNALEANNLDEKSGVSDVSAFMRDIGVFEPEFNRRQLTQNKKRAQLSGADDYLHRKPDQISFEDCRTRRKHC